MSDLEKNDNYFNKHIFKCNRVIGQVTNHVPALIRYIRRRRDNLIITCIGHSFQVHTASHFRLLHVSGQHPDDITAMAADRAHIYTACNKCIYAWRAGKHIRHVYRGHTKNVHTLLPFARHLIAVDEGNVLKVWNIKKAEVYLEVPFEEDFKVTAVAHPSTYVNKIVLGSEGGQLKLLNIRNNHLIYTFNVHSSRITCIEPAPAVNVVAVGHQDGCINVIDLLYNEVLMRLKQDWGAVLDITFRTDGAPVMASASSNGFVAFWNLEDKKIIDQLQAHEDAVSTAIFLPNEPLMLTTSPDNSMKLWIFDMVDGGARMLRIREGHIRPPLCIRYHGHNGSTILSSGEDSSLRAFSTISATFNKSLGKASYDRKSSKKKNRFQDDSFRMPPIIEFTSETTCEEEWDNIAAIHAGTLQTTTWSFHKSRMGDHYLIPEKFHNENRTDFIIETTCITLTHCGNFAIIGYSTGDVEKFNIQSGQHRGSYGNPGHTAAVRGIITDNLNQMVVSGCSSGLLKFWCFREKVEKPWRTIQLLEGVAFMRSHRESSIVAVALVNFTILIVDLDTKGIIRKFEGHNAKLNDLTFSPDSRWLISASMDATIKVWDIPSSYMIDHFRVEKPCTSLSMSPTGDFLATAHVNCLGIYLWANKTLFNRVSLHSVNPRAEAPLMELENIDNQITTRDFVLINSQELEVNEEENLEQIDFIYITPERLSENLISISNLPASKWQNLLDLDLIKKRNYPKNLSKVIKPAPFFIPTVAGLEMKYDTSNMGNVRQEANESKIMKPSLINNLTDFAKLLESTVSSHDYESCVNHLKRMNPTNIDFEMKSLNNLGGRTTKVMVQFLKIIQYMLSSNVDFELAQSYLSIFLRRQGTELLEFPEVIETLQSVAKLQQASWDKIEKNLMFGIGVVGTLRNFTQ
uniref:Small-subunit processome Utp21 domain-containing protein n=1 Tax=Glossina brevipalpis TaxID=37001 RepID=A0A1A9WSG0_9MUSC